MAFTCFMCLIDFTVKTGTCQLEILASYIRDAMSGLTTFSDFLNFFFFFWLHFKCPTISLEIREKEKEHMYLKKKTVNLFL